MELAAYLDEHDVEMHILTETGQAIAIVCPNDSIFAIQRHIAQIGADCPEISTWSDKPFVRQKTVRNVAPRALCTESVLSPSMPEKLHG